MLVIALATYNGQEFLDELLESVVGQTVQDWTLLIGDDRSTDETRRILEGWAARDPRIRILPDAPQSLGAIGNFGRLMQAACEAGAEYLAFADQDDVWLPNKLARQVELMRSVTARRTSRTPVLVHSDLAVVDRDLQQIHPSFKRYVGLADADDSHDVMRSLLLHNSVTGCTVLINRPLLELALPLPSAAVMHDWWLALCAGAAGQIRFCPDATILYRQHGKNAIGARGSLLRLALSRLTGGRAIWNRDMANFVKTLQQAAALRARLQQHHHLPVRDAGQLLEAFCAVFEQPLSGWARVARLIGLRLPAAHRLRQVLTYARVLLLNRYGVPTLSLPRERNASGISQRAA